MRCQSCGANITGNAIFCSRCGFRVQDACAGCGRYNEQDADECFYCGTRLRELLPVASWRRLTAFFIDVLALSLAMLTVWQVSSLLPGLEWANTLEVSSSPDYDITIRWPGIVIITLNYTVCVAVWSATLGKKALGLQTLRPNGSRIGIGRAFARFIVFWCSVPFLMLPFLMIIFRRDKRGLHDLICDTVVVRR